VRRNSRAILMGMLAMGLGMPNLLHGQLPEPTGAPSSAPNPFSDPTVKSAKWSPKEYLLTWTPTDAAMGPSGDMGYTWGHFEGSSKDANGNPVTTSGRYMTIWRKQPDGSWKVVLDAGANEPAASADCCKVASGS
jgi:hypothetical protein